MFTGIVEAVGEVAACEEDERLRARVSFTDITVDAPRSLGLVQAPQTISQHLLSGRLGAGSCSTMVDYSKFNNIEASDSEDEKQTVDPDKAEAWLLRKHPEAHAVRTDKSLYDYVDALKGRHMRNAGTLNKVAYDGQDVRKLILDAHVGDGDRVVDLAESEHRSLKSKRQIAVHVARSFLLMPRNAQRVVQNSSD